MSTKVQQIFELFHDTTKSFSDYRNWTNFLKTAAWQYKYPFEDQVLIHAQRPDVTACATIEVWNKNMHRWINKGAKGIALLRENGSRYGLEYVFDISNTNDRYNREVRLWKYNARYDDAIIETLANNFGELKVDTTITDAIICAAHNAVEDNKYDYLHEIGYVKSNSLLHGLDEVNIDLRFRQTAEVSVAYMVMQRMGLEPDDIFGADEFEHMRDFNTHETISILGNAVSAISEAALRNISETIRAEQKKFAQLQKQVYNENIKQERNDEDGRNIDVQDERRLSDSQSERTDTGTQDRKIRNDEKDIPETASPEPVLHVADERDATRTFGGNRQDSDTAGRDDSRSDGEIRGSDGDYEIEGSDALDRADEQLPTFGGGSSTVGVGAQRNLFDMPLPTEEEQQNMIREAEQRRSSAFSVPQQIIDEVLTTGSNNQNSVLDICTEYSKNKSSAENIEFLKQEYGTGGKGFIFDGDKISVWWNDEGIKIAHGESAVTAKRYELVTWDMADKRISELLNLGRYVTQETIDSINRHECSKAASAFWFMKRDVNFDEYPELRELFNEEWFDGGYPDSTARIAEMLAKPDDREKLISVVEMLDAEYSENTDVMRFKMYRPDKVLAQLNDLKREHLHFRADEYQSSTAQRFITEDEIDKLFLRGSGMDRGKIRIYLYFQEHTDTKERIDFLKQEYGTGGHSGGLFSEWHDAKGITFSRDDILSPLAKVNISWNSAAKRIDSLIKSGRYMSEKEITEISSEKKIEKSSQILEEKEDNADEIKPSEEKQEETLIPIYQKPKERVQNTVIYPEIPMSERHNFTIDNDELGHGTASQKYQANVTAIRTLKTLESEHRLATPEEQEILSQYVGWGGLSDCFSEKHSKYQELKSLLTDEEYRAARESTLTAFYTPPIVIRSMYKALENMGLKQGNILDPSMGIGNFEGMLPDSLNACKIYGIELDSISGRIAQQLYQKNSVAIQGYEDTTLPDSFFDVAIGNVPFGQFKVMDKRYDKHNFLIHDYFFAKTLDKVRPGGVVAFITSSGTMDKKNSNVRKYIAQRADLLGAIRLPDNTFKANAGTEVTSDIIFLQKRDRMTDIMPEWVNVGTLDNGHILNQYFIDNPDMILGEIVEESGPFGMQISCKAYDDADLSELLDGAIQNIHAQITEYEVEDISNDEELSIPADANVKNFSYTIIDGNIYFRENSRMNKVDVSLTAQNRIKGMIEIRDCVKELIEYQTEDYPEYEIKAQQDRLNTLYDEFTAKYGLINSRGNSTAFSNDSSYFLLCSLEVLNENRELERKADMFTKRTIGARKEVTQVDTATEALAVSIGEKARIDMEYMSELTGKSEQELYNDLKGVIFLNPHYDENIHTQDKYLNADEYLSGNVREKLAWAKCSAERYPEDYTVNVEALTKVQPKDLTASEITIRLGATWIPPKYIKEFTFELLSPSYWASRNIDVQYSKLTGTWNVVGKNYDKANVKANNTYGTKRINAYKIIEESLNLKDVRIFDYIENEKGNRVAVLNQKETTIAQQKQDLIKNEFDNWIWKDPDRREALTKLYNEKFNSVRPREYDGSHIRFSGMNPEIQLRTHQKNAVARVMYGGNSLLGHVVGAGKTWTMVSAAMEMKRLGLCNKSLFVVPNHLTEQWSSEFLQLYPAANIFVATKKDFETKNRKKFCGRIATGDYDAVIIGHCKKVCLKMILHLFTMRTVR